MKKSLTCILALAMCLALTACGGGGGGQSQQPSQSGGGTVSGTPASGAASSGQTEADSDLAYVQGKGELVVGITEFEPMDYRDARDRKSTRLNSSHMA